MSTIVAVKKAGRICIAADTLTSYGSTKESAEMIVNHEKIIRVGRTFIGVVGPAAAHLVLQNYFSRLRRKPSLRCVDTIFEAFRQMQITLKDEYFVNPVEEKDDPYESMQMSCLLVNRNGIFGVYSMRGVQEYAKICAFGSGYSFALGAMHACYDRVKTADAIARLAIEASAEFDDATALPMTSYALQTK